MGFNQQAIRLAFMMVRADGNPRKHNLLTTSRTLCNLRFACRVPLLYPGAHHSLLLGAGPAIVSGEEKHRCSVITLSMTPGPPCHRCIMDESRLFFYQICENLFYVGLSYYISWALISVMLSISFQLKPYCLFC